LIELVIRHVVVLDLAGITFIVDVIRRIRHNQIDVIVLKSYTEDYPESKRRLNTGQKALYQALGVVPAIITKEQFQEVAAEKGRRSNITRTDAGRIRKSTHYSMKRAKVEPINDQEISSESV